MTGAGSNRLLTECVGQNMAKHRAYRTPVLIAMSVSAATTVAAALVLTGSAGAADSTDPQPACPNGYVPAVGQQVDPQSTLCVSVGSDKAGNTHAIIRIDPLLCAHAVVGNNGKPVSTDPGERRDVVRTLRCPREIPPALPSVPAPVPDNPVPATNAPLPEAPVPPIVGATLPVTG